MKSCARWGGLHVNDEAHVIILSLFGEKIQVYEIGLEFEVWILVFDLFRSSKV